MSRTTGLELFLRDLWIFLIDCDCDLRHFVRDIYDLAQDYNERSDYAVLCYMCFEIAKRIKKPLPLHIHNRLLLGESNEHVKNYIKYTSKL